MKPKGPVFKCPFCGGDSRSHGPPKPNGSQRWLCKSAGICAKSFATVDGVWAPGWSIRQINGNTVCVRSKKARKSQARDRTEYPSEKARRDEARALREQADEQQRALHAARKGYEDRKQLRELQSIAEVGY
jgi:hypothetical protein